MLVIGDQIVRTRSYCAVSKDIVVGVTCDDLEMKGRRNANNVVTGQFHQIHKPRQLSPPRRAAHSRKDFLIFQQQFRGTAQVILPATQASRIG